jgi:pentatricopeptide repeat protein
VIIGNALMDMYTKSSKMDHALAVFAGMEISDACTYGM